MLCTTPFALPTDELEFESALAEIFLVAEELLVAEISDDFDEIDFLTGLDMPNENPNLVAVFDMDDEFDVVVDDAEEVDRERRAIPPLELI